MVSIKVNRKALVATAKEDKPKKANFTFRLNEGLYNEFKDLCDKDKVKPTAIIEAFLKEYIKQ